MSRGNRANRNAFISIPAEVKELLRHLHPAIQHMPKGERYDGIGAELKRAAYAILRCYHTAYFCPALRMEKIGEMVGWYGHLQAAFELSCLEGVMRDEFKLPIAMRMERIEEGTMKWNNSQPAQRQELANALAANAAGAAG